MRKVCVLQRESHVANDVKSLSVDARIVEALGYLAHHHKIEYVVVSENSEIANKAIEWSDVLYLNKHSSNEAYLLAEYAKKIKRKVIYDIDDWIFKFPEYSSGKALQKNKNFIMEILSLADVISVANENLLNKTSKVITNAVLVPNGMWVEKYSTQIKLSKNYSANKCRIIFTNADFIKLKKSKSSLLTALQTYFVENRTASMDFYGDIFPEIFTLPFINYTNRLGYENYMKLISRNSYTFSISPLGGIEDKENYEFNKCKNPFKYLNYGVASIPGIYSNTPIYSNLVVDRENGLLIENTYESWINAMDLMSKDANLRNRIITNSYNDILENHHIRSSAKIISEILN